MTAATADQSGLTQARTVTAKSPAHWHEPASDKGSAAQQQKQLKPGKSDLKAPANSDWHYAAKQQGVGFSGNATAVPKPQRRQSDSGSNPPEHKYHQVN
jgi:hypothetical protein